jgi:hypothetical protein
MNCRKVVLGTWLFVLSLSLGAAVLCAQEEPPPAPDAPPKPAGYSFPGIGTGQQEGELQPDFSPLTGMQNPTLGMPGIRHSYWVPGFQFSSNEFSSSGGSGWTSDNYFIGNLSLVQAWSRALLAVNYSGGGYVSSNSQQGGGFYQQLALAQNYQTERWLIQFVDQYSRIPQSSFGFGGGTNLGIPGVGGSLGNTIPGLGGNYTPNQTIYGTGTFTSNVSALQATYALSRRSSLTVAGSYGLLRFEKAGNYDSNTTIASAGYNYELTRNDTLGLVYRYGSYQYPGNPQAYTDNAVNVAYGRKVTGHLGLGLFIGPEITNFRIPIGNSSQRTGLSASANMTYAFERGVFTVAYLHGLSAGSGVLLGSNLDWVTATVSRQLTRQWSGSLIFGYSHNSPVVGTGAGSSPAYGDWYVGGSATRPIGRNFSFAVAYTATIGSYSGAGCTGAGCNVSNNYNTITVNFQWHPRPFTLP